MGVSKGMVVHLIPFKTEAWPQQGQIGSMVSTPLIQLQAFFGAAEGLEYVCLAAGWERGEGTPTAGISFYPENAEGITKLRAGESSASLSLWPQGVLHSLEDPAIPGSALSKGIPTTVHPTTLVSPWGASLIIL